MRNKTLQQLTLQELASIHLDTYAGRHSLADGWIESGMGHLVTEIEQSIPRVDTGFFSPLYGAFALLDQIGDIYSDRSMAPCSNADASGIKKALYFFGGMTFDGPEMKALYGLRNALVHDGSLVYRGRFDHRSSAWRGPFHKFRWNKNLKEPIKLPREQWDGTMTNLGPDVTTEINVREICRLSISSVRKATSALKKGNLDIHVREGEIELYYRYLFHQKANE